METTTQTTINAGDVIAVGDVHGRFDLLSKFVDMVKGSGAHVILLGDLIDRGPQDVEVLQLAHALATDPQAFGLQAVTVLRGNHEQLFLDHNRSFRDKQDWEHNGGAIHRVAELEQYRDWLSQLPLYTIVGDTLYSHTGAYPGEDPALAMRTEDDMRDFVWQRECAKYGPQFALWRSDLKLAVFGHTPHADHYRQGGGPNRGLPYAVPQGLCIDTLAYDTGVLTAYNRNTDQFIPVTM